jgi:hypothetical protein
MLRRFATPVLLLIVGLVFVPGLADAGKPPKKSATTSTSSITLNQADPHLGGPVSFAVTYADSVKSPRVAVRCYQNGTLGYAEAGPYDTTFTLGGSGSDWKTAGGPAQCSGELFYFVWNGNNQQEYYSLAWTYFDAAG